MRSKRIEVVAVILAGLILAYMAGYYDGASARHHMEVYGHE